jgi:hypothetical protein
MQDAAKRHAVRLQATDPPRVASELIESLL